VKSKRKTGRKKPPSPLLRPISPRIDDPDESKSIGAAVQGLLAAQKIPDESRLTRHLEWLGKPNVTLEQAGWLLLGFDPWYPPSDSGPSSASPSHRHKRLVDCLEGAVAEKKLKPLRASRAARVDRFRLLDVAATSRDACSTTIISIEILTAALRQPPPDKPETRTERIARRLEWHRHFVNALDDERKSPAPRKSPRKHARRANPGKLLNVTLSMKGPAYDREFAAYVRHQFGKPNYRFDTTMLKDDRRSLNIKLQPGRHRKFD